MAAPVIHRVLEETKGKEEKEIKKALREAYPFGARENHPYKIWCDEINRQRGKKKRTKVQMKLDSMPKLF